jgi:hypothetical protein
MKKATAIAVILSLIIFNTAQLSPLYAQDAVVEKISTIERAKEIAIKAEGEYWEAEKYWETPVEGEGKIALPVQDQETGEVLGYIVADKEKLIAALNAYELTDAANALAAMEAGEAAGGAASAGIFSGTTMTVVLVIAAVAGIAVAVGGGGGGGGGGGSTTRH